MLNRLVESFITSSRLALLTASYRINPFALNRSQIKPRTGLFKEVIVENMPDPHVARESVWLPFLQKCFVCRDTVSLAVDIQA